MCVCVRVCVSVHVFVYVNAQGVYMMSKYARGKNDACIITPPPSTTTTTTSTTTTTYRYEIISRCVVNLKLTHSNKGLEGMHYHWDGKEGMHVSDCEGVTVSCI